MIILPDLLNQVAVYWPPGTIDKFNKVTPGTPVELTCRWESNQQDMIDLDGDTYVSTATIWHENSTVALRGWLWLSTASPNDTAGTALAEAPGTPPHRQIIRSLAVIPDVDAEETLYKAFV